MAPLSASPWTRKTMTRFTSVLAIVLLVCHDGSAFSPTPIRPTTTSTTSSDLFYQINVTDTSFAAAAAVRPQVNIKYNVDHVDNEKDNHSILEVNRHNLHPIFKLGWIPLEIDIPLSVMAAMAVMVSPILIPLLPFVIQQRKKRWEKLVETSKKEHQAAFEETTLAYRQSQRALVDKLLQQQQSSKQDMNLPRVIAVTMATGQEGQGVVRALAESSKFRHSTILALTRNPNSSAAQALARLSPNIQLVACDSTDVESLRAALQPAEAVFLATTLNRASAGHWEMNWNGGQYQILQGQVFAEACSGLANLKQVVYGTAPLQKWPDGFVSQVEPPIHYAAKWRVEQILREAKLPVTYLRKCPYHENFTKLTKATARTQADRGGSSRPVAAMGVEAGGAFDIANRKVELQPGQYQIKAFTPPDFVYNMMDPRDTGKWAVLAFSHPSILVGASLSVASDALSGAEMARAATESQALGEGATFSYARQPRWLFETLAFVEPTFVYISGLQRWNCDGGLYDLDADGVEHVRKLVPGSTWSDHLEREGLGQFTETMADLLPDVCKRF